MRRERAWAAVSVAAFAGSLALPGFAIETHDPGSPGVLIMLVGWLGLAAATDVVANLAWLANLALIGAWVLLWSRRGVAAAVTSALAIGLAALPALTRQVAVDEAGMPRAIHHFGSGYALWTGAMAVALVGGLDAARRRLTI